MNMVDCKILRKTGVLLQEENSIKEDFVRSHYSKILIYLTCSLYQIRRRILYPSNTEEEIQTKVKHCFMFQNEINQL
jgi:hypothetical protein